MDAFLARTHLENVQGHDSIRQKLSDRGEKARALRRSASAEEIVEATLLELVQDGTSDSARVSAAKALMDFVKSGDDKENDIARQHEQAERDAAVDEARRLLGEIAASLSASFDCAVKVDDIGAVGSTDTVVAGKKVADLVDPCGARLGEDADGR